MSMPFSPTARKATFLLAVGLMQPAANAEWQRDDTSLAWRSGTNVLWRFAFDPKMGKPFFHPLAGRDGFSLTNFRPPDHSWHYGLWFSWKYINQLNYWEESRETGRAEGATRWSQPVIETQPNGAATIRLDLTYANPSNRVDLTESRELKVSAPGRDGSFTIDWRAHFTAGIAGAVLDRTPMLGEPKGQTNGGYAGLGLRLPSAPLTMAVLCTTGLVTHFEGDRARPDAEAVACNFFDGKNFCGGIAIFSDPNNAGENAPWYIVDSGHMRFVCAAILAPKIRTLSAGEQMILHYRIAVHNDPWTVAGLKTGYAAWRLVKSAKGPE
jgi:hypothetical protein